MISPFHASDVKSNSFTSLLTYVDLLCDFNPKGRLRVPLVPLLGRISLSDLYTKEEWNQSDTFYLIGPHGSDSITTNPTLLSALNLRTLFPADCGPVEHSLFFGPHSPFPPGTTFQYIPGGSSYSMLFFLRSILEVYIDFFTSDLVTPSMRDRFLAYQPTSQSACIAYLSSLGSSFVKVVKFYTAYPMAAFLRQEDMPPRPSQIPEVRTWLWDGDFRKFLKQITLYRNPEYAPLIWGTLQGVKRGCASVPDTFVSDSYASHFRTMAMESRNSLLQEKALDLKEILLNPDNVLPLWGDENERASELEEEIKILEDKTGIRNTRAKATLVFNILPPGSDFNGTIYRPIKMEEFDALDSPIEPSSSASYRYSSRKGGQRMDVMQEVMPPVSLPVSFPTPPSGDLELNLLDAIDVGLVNSFSELESYYRQQLSMGDVLRSVRQSHPDHQYIRDWYSGVTRSWSTDDLRYSLSSILRVFCFRLPLTYSVDDFLFASEPPFVIPRLLSQLPDGIPQLISSFLGYTVTPEEESHVVKVSSAYTEMKMRSENQEISSILSSITNGVTYDPSFGDIDVGLQKMFVTDPNSVHEIRGHLPAFFPYTSPRRYLLSLQQLQPDIPVEANVIALIEPLKVRVITTGEAAAYYLSKPLQRSFWKHLYQFPQFVLTGQPLTVEILDQLEDSTLAFCAKYSVPTLDQWVSGDYKGATDTLDILSSMASFSAGINVLSQHSQLSEQFEKLLDLNRQVLDRHTLNYPKGTLSSLTHDQIVELGGYYGENGEVKLLQGTGQLMGSPLSFPILCLINFIAYWTSMEKYLGREIPDFWELPVRINGDDILFKSNTEHYSIWKEEVKVHSFELSMGKNYIHPRFLTVNSVLYYYTRHHDGSPADFGKVPYLNVGLLLSQSKGVDRDPQRRLPFAELYRISVGDSCNVRRSHDRFIHYNIKQIKQFTNNGQFNLFIPVHLGGLGFPLLPLIRDWRVPSTDGGTVFKVSFTKFQIQFATFLSMRVEQVSLTGEIPYKYFAALVPQDLASYMRDLNTARKKIGKSEVLPPAGALSPVMYYTWKGLRPLQPLYLPSGFDLSSSTIFKDIMYVEPSSIKRTLLSYSYDTSLPLQYRLPSRSVMSEFSSFFMKGDEKGRFSLPLISSERLLSNEQRPVYVDREALHQLFSTTGLSDLMGDHGPSVFLELADLNNLPHTPIHLDYFL
ncbi:RNA-dependent RNA polymerase [Hubei narna-like virus 11]|uniref:RNA-dependent RNA polymerase n=1 Tax=Hubei narna-like virus 11 TaxID=1922941 RepID=UPI000909AB77|nr:RNA-dependent RNA polymerase [Hubei narna-like virus 11]APG77212.1 RNA-dependent RNA polymerase [Hubei narna-like virus 11]